ncbi:GNAT family N-acetyltransferase [Arthrobacter bambusae]|uniref:GNAT family N-acetyltransferase n=1 Tax=Arthrobacter bambusae TaxID=1338426 RepID=UPI00277FBB90|nr:GNAT family N-acetyltransferase [Arthrobacter bambusae]MDQ0031630.1 ribosomal protein S18 acetylase RimI-like enzyme [Arthrobacter bambusae]MDQ0099854.1 ribosomal protein S18 acetylase RimI-like enzyme [Arthrobacter bambusae]
MNAEVRPAQGSDIALILAVEAKAGRPLPDPSRLATALDDESRLVVVATARGTSGVGGLLGWGKTHFWAYDDDAAPAGHYLGGITVRPDSRRSGIGTALTQARLDWIWRRALEAWYVVNASNIGSIELHRRWGFVEVARAPSFHTTTFDGGAGILMRAARPTTPE